MCEDPPEVKVSINTGRNAESLTFDESTVRSFPGGTFTAVLDWDSNTKILGLEVRCMQRGCCVITTPHCMCKSNYTTLTL